MKSTTGDTRPDAQVAIAMGQQAHHLDSRLAELVSAVQALEQGYRARLVVETVGRTYGLDLLGKTALPYFNDAIKECGKRRHEIAVKLGKARKILEG